MDVSPSQFTCALYALTFSTSLPFFSSQECRNSSPRTCTQVRGEYPLSLTYTVRHSLPGPSDICLEAWRNFGYFQKIMGMNVFGGRELFQDVFRRPGCLWWRFLAKVSDSSVVFYFCRQMVNDCRWNLWITVTPKNSLIFLVYLITFSFWFSLKMLWCMVLNLSILCVRHAPQPFSLSFQSEMEHILPIFSQLSILFYFLLV